MGDGAPDCVEFVEHRLDGCAPSDPGCISLGSCCPICLICGRCAAHPARVLQPAAAPCPAGPSTSMPTSMGTRASRQPPCRCATGGMCTDSCSLGCTNQQGSASQQLGCPVPAHARLAALHWPDLQPCPHSAAANGAGAPVGQAWRGCRAVGAPPQVGRGGSFAGREAHAGRQGVGNERGARALPVAATARLQIAGAPQHKQSCGLPCPAAPATLRCSYQRTCPVLAQRCRPHTGLGGGVVHLCVGHAGAQWYDNGFVARPDWVAFEVGGCAGAGRNCAHRKVS